MSITGRNDADIINFIVGYSTKNGYPPSVTDMVAEFGVARSTMQWHLDRLMRDGKLRRPFSAHRAITVTEQGMKYIASPLEQL